MAFPVPTSLSPSRVEAFTSCPLAFRFSTIDRLPEPAAPRHQGHARPPGPRAALRPRRPTAPPTPAVPPSPRPSTELRTDPDCTSSASTPRPRRRSSPTPSALVRRYFELEDPRRRHRHRPRAARSRSQVGRPARCAASSTGSSSTTTASSSSPTTRPAARRWPSASSSASAASTSTPSCASASSASARPASSCSTSARARSSTARPTEQSIRFLPAPHRGRVAAPSSGPARRSDFRPRTGPLCDWCAFQPYCPAFGGDPDRAKFEAPGLRPRPPVQLPLSSRRDAPSDRAPVRSAPCHRAGSTRGRPGLRPPPGQPGRRPGLLRRLRAGRLEPAVAPDRRDRAPASATDQLPDAGPADGHPGRRVGGRQRASSALQAGAAGLRGHRGPTRCARPSPPASRAATPARRSAPPSCCSARPARSWPALVRRWPPSSPLSRIYVRIHHAQRRRRRRGHRPGDRHGRAGSWRRLAATGDRSAGIAARPAGVARHVTRAFAVTWDYRCPFARIAHEHVHRRRSRPAPTGTSRFVPFSLGQVHVGGGRARRLGRRPSTTPGLLALQAGVVVRDQFPDQFLAVAPRRCSPLRHDEGLQLNDPRRASAGVLDGRRRRRRRRVRRDRRRASRSQPIRKEHDRWPPSARGVGRAHLHRRRPGHLRPAHAPPRGRRRRWPERTGRARRRPARRWPDLNEFKHTIASPAERVARDWRRCGRPDGTSLPGHVGQPAVRPRFERRMSDVEALLWNVDKDPYLSSNFASVTLLDRLARPRPVPSPAWRGPSRASPACTSGCCRRRTAWRRRRGWTTPTSTSTTTSATSPCPRPGSLRQLLDLATLFVGRPVRPHPAAVGVRAWSTALDGRPGGPDPEDAPHDHRRRGRHPAVDAVHRRGPRRPRADRPLTDRASWPPPDARADTRRTAGRRAREAPRQRPGLSARPSPQARPTCWPSRADLAEIGTSPGKSVRRPSAHLTDTERAHSPLWTEPILRRRLEVLQAPLDDGDGRPRRWAARSTPPSSPRPRPPPALPPRARAPRSTSCGRPWRSAPGRRHPAPTASCSPGCWCPPARCRWPSGSTRSRPRPTRCGRRPSPARLGLAGRRWPPRCPPRWWCASPASRPRRSTSPPRTCGRRRSPLYIGGRAGRGDLPDRAAGRVAFNLTLMSYGGEPEHGPARRHRRGRPNPSCCGDLMEMPSPSCSRPAPKARTRKRAGGRAAAPAPSVRTAFGGEQRCGRRAGGRRPRRWRPARGGASRPRRGR